MTVIDKEHPEVHGAERTTMTIQASETPEIQSNKSAVRFARDDLELRAVTTLLAGLKAVDCPERKTDAEPHDSMSSLQRFQLRHLTAISSLLARDGEVVVCTPKLTGHGLEVFITTTVSAQVQTSASDNTPAYSKPNIKLISENAIEIKGSDDVCKFIIDNWILGFERHAQVVAKLVNDCIEVGAKSSDAWKKLSRYCVAQSSPKLAKCFASRYLTIFINALHESSCEPGSALVIPDMSSNDCGYLKAMMRKLHLFNAPEYLKLAEASRTIQGNSCQITPEMLPEICRLFRHLMNELCKTSHKVAAMRDAPSEPLASSFAKMVSKLWHLLRYLEYLVTYSNFFRWFITEHLERSIQRTSADDKPEVGELDKEKDNQENLPRFRENVNFAVSEPAWEVLRWLRLITSNIHSACTFYKSQFLRMATGRNHKIKFKLLQLAPPSAHIMDWKDVVTDLFSTDDGRERVVEHLSGKNFTTDWKFVGSLHCAAVLRCLSTMASREVNSVCIPAPLDDLR